MKVFSYGDLKIHSFKLKEMLEISCGGKKNKQYKNKKNNKLNPNTGIHKFYQSFI